MDIGLAVVLPWLFRLRIFRILRILRRIRLLLFVRRRLLYRLTLPIGRVALMHALIEASDQRLDQCRLDRSLAKEVV